MRVIGFLGVAGKIRLRQDSNKKKENGNSIANLNWQVNMMNLSKISIFGPNFI